jgi:hypothetical protein
MRNIQDKTKEADACRLLARIPNNRQGRAALACIRANWNREGYRLRVLFSGPRAPHAYGTVKKNAKVFRLYADRTGQTAAEKYARQFAIEREQLMMTVRNDRDRATARANALDKALMGAEANLRNLRVDMDGTMRSLEQANVACNKAQNEAMKWHRMAMGAQEQLNFVPGWILWCVGFWTEARAILARNGV